MHPLIRVLIITRQHNKARQYAIPAHITHAFEQTTAAPPAASHRPRYKNTDNSRHNRSRRHTDQQQQPQQQGEVELQQGQPVDVHLLPLRDMRQWMKEQQTRITDEPDNINRLITIIHRMRVLFSSHLTADDYQSILRVLSVLNARSPHLQKASVELMLAVLDEFLSLEPHLPLSVFVSVLSACSRSGQGESAERVLESMLSSSHVSESVSVLHYNLVLYAWRHSQEQMWKWVQERMNMQTRNKQQRAADTDPQHTHRVTVAANADTYAILLSCSMPDDRLDYMVSALDVNALYSAADSNCSFSCLDQLFNYHLYRCVSTGCSLQPIVDLYLCCRSLGCRPSHQHAYVAVLWAIRSLCTTETVRRGKELLGLRLLTQCILKEMNEQDMDCTYAAGLLLEMTTPTTSNWHSVLTQYDWLINHGWEDSIEASFGAILACYYGTHWQRANSILQAIDTETQNTENQQTDKHMNTNHRHAASSLPWKSLPAASAVALDSVDFHALLSCPPSYLHTALCSSISTSPSLSATRCITPRFIRQIVRSFPATFAVNLPHTPRRPHKFRLSFLHYVYTLAAMDAAGNAEAERRARLLEQEILVLFCSLCLDSRYKKRNNCHSINVQLPTWETEHQMFDTEEEAARKELEEKHYEHWIWCVLYFARKSLSSAGSPDQLTVNLVVQEPFVSGVWTALTRPPFSFSPGQIRTIQEEYRERQANNKQQDHGKGADLKTIYIPAAWAQCLLSE